MTWKNSQVKEFKRAIITMIKITQNKKEAKMKVE